MEPKTHGSNCGTTPTVTVRNRKIASGGLKSNWDRTDRFSYGAVKVPNDGTVEPPVNHIIIIIIIIF